MIFNKLTTYKETTGFTLVELIVVIILLGIMSITVSSRFSGASGYSEYIYQARLISVLRNMQLRAMYDTREDYCFQVNLVTSPAAFGPPTMSYNIGTALDTCVTDIDFINNPEFLTTTATEMTQAAVSLSTLPSFGFISFNSLGKPIDANGAMTCDNVCKITLTGKSAVSVCIESEGYVHACG
jgi:MSHA pilin protein MshC